MTLSACCVTEHRGGQSSICAFELCALSLLCCFFDCVLGAVHDVLRCAGDERQIL